MSGGHSSVHGGVATTANFTRMTNNTFTHLLETTQPHEAFCGALGDQAGPAWGYAVDAIVKVSRQTPAAAARFLDSTPGRYFGLCVCERLERGSFLPDAVMSTTFDWMLWKTDRFAAKLYDVPEGAPYLLALIAHFANAKT